MKLEKEVPMIDEWDITATNLNRAAARHYEVAIIPTSAIEPHNRHLPYGQDFRHTTYVSRQVSELAWKRSQSIICLPTIPFGVDCNLLDFPLAIHVSQNILDALLKDIVHSLRRHGIRKILILNGHGGNDFGPFIRHTQSDLDVFLFLCNWWMVGMDRYSEIFENPDDHAGEMETSVALALFPELVEREAAGNGLARPFRFEALVRGWIRTSRDFSKLNDHCAVGDPDKSTAEKGKQYLDLICDRISSFLVELACTPIDDAFPQVP